MPRANRHYIPGYGFRCQVIVGVRRDYQIEKEGVMINILKFSTIVGFGLLLCFLSSAEGQTDMDSIEVLFEDGATVKVNNWNFHYKYGESDTKQSGFFTFSYSTYESKDLLVNLGTKEEHGFKIDNERKIPVNKLKLIKFYWDGKKVKNVSVHLTDGEIIKIPNRLNPAKGLLSTKKYVFGGGCCPCIYLKGSGLLNGKPRSFEVLLNNWEYKESSQRISEIIFKGNIRK